MDRRDKVNYYLDLAEVVSQRGTCLRRRFGAVIVKNDEVLATGYTGAPRGRKNCTDLGICIRQELKIPRGERYELCRSVHAEANAIISASRDQMIGSSLYLTGIEIDTNEYVKNASSCSMCKRMIINAGIENVYIRDTKNTYRIIEIEDWIKNDESLERQYGYQNKNLYSIYYYTGEHTMDENELQKQLGKLNSKNSKIVVPQEVRLYMAKKY